MLTQDVMGYYGTGIKGKGEYEEQISNLHIQRGMNVRHEIQP